MKKKRRNQQFKDLIVFLQNWTYQTILYELKDKLIFYGYLLSKFDYTKEKIVLNELFEKIDTNYSFLLNKKDFYQSNLSLYSLPTSNQFIEEIKSWNLNEIRFPITISEKENFIKKQNHKERKN